MRFTLVPLAAAHPVATSFSGTSALVSTSAVGLGLLALGGWLLWRNKRFKKDKKKLVSWIWFFAGFFLSGGLASAIAGMFSQVGGTGAHMFGVGTNVFLTIGGIILCLELWHHIHPKHGDVRPVSPFLALATPILVISGSGGLLYSIFAGISGMLGHVSGPLSALFGG